MVIDAGVPQVRDLGLRLPRSDRTDLPALAARVSYVQNEKEGGPSGPTLLVVVATGEIYVAAM